MIPTAANGQPAFALYPGDDDRLLAAESVQVMTLRGGRIGKVSTFRTPGLVAVAGFAMETAMETGMEKETGMELEA